MAHSLGINYKLQKKIKKGEVDDEVEIINSYARANNVYLPIEEYSKEFIYTLETSNVVIIMGETGSGKTTSKFYRIKHLEIPEFIYKSGHCNIAHILPRKISAITVAQRVAKNMNFTLGKEVGYSVRFDYNYSADTKIKFLTEGMFIREMLNDPLLKAYNYVIVDDCHERTINSELIFGLLKKIFAKRNDLKIIISSATLDYDAYESFFSKSSGFITKKFIIPGRTYPVDIYYCEQPVKNYVQAAISTALTIHKNFPINSGDILIFLTGQEEINNFIELSGGTGLDKQDVLLLPLCSGLNIERQLEVFKPTPYSKRKIVLSTNIAEASVTIDNIGYVIDSCFVKMKFYNSKIDADALYIIPASKFSLDQRAGRAGRTRPGKCFRLVTKQTYDDLYLMTNPELLRSNLLEYVLRIKSMGIKNIGKFQTITIPDLNSVSRALETLYFIGVLDENSTLTSLGLKSCDIPIDSRLSVALINSATGKFKCTDEMLIICSMLSVPNLFYAAAEPSTILKAKQKLGVIEGDHLTYLSIYTNWKNCKTSKSQFCKELHINENSMKQVEEILNNLKLYMKKYSIPIKRTLDEDGEDILKSLLTGFFLNIAQKQYDGSYKNLKNSTVLYLHPTSVLYTIMPEYIFYSDLIISAKNYMKDCSKVDKTWIIEIGSNYYVDKSQQLIREKHKQEVKIQNKLELLNKDNSHPQNNFNYNKLQYGKISLDKVGETLKDEKKQPALSSQQDKIFENDFNKMNEQKQKSLLGTEADQALNNSGKEKTIETLEEKKKKIEQKKNYLIKNYLEESEEENEEADDDNILNIKPAQALIQRKNLTNDNPNSALNEDKTQSSKPKNPIATGISNKLNTNHSEFKSFNYDEYFNKDEIKNQIKFEKRKLIATQRQEVHNMKMPEEFLTLNKSEHTPHEFIKRKIKNLDFNKNISNDEDERDNLSILPKGNNHNNPNEKKLHVTSCEREYSKNTEKNQINNELELNLPEDEEERIAILRRKKNVKVKKM